MAMKKALLGLACLAALICIISLYAGNTAAAERSKVLIKLETNMGDITLELDREKAPITTDNFIKYVEEGFYDGTVFHRVINGFMVQGGGFDKEMQQKATRANIQNEADNGLKNEAYTVAMARTPDPHSASSQFFINVNNNEFLNHQGKSQDGWGYAVFGKVVDGREVVDKIKAVKTGSKGFHRDVPVDTVQIVKATVLEK
jgi:peptidyl-prolyl cis-trans isomerase B (cyclophilin B)